MFSWLRRLPVFVVGLALLAGGLSLTPEALPVAAAAAQPKLVEKGDLDDTPVREDPVSAMRTAIELDKKVEDRSRRTESARVFANPDGTWGSSIYAGAALVQDEAEGDDPDAWHWVDNDLVARDGVFAAKHSPVDAVVSGGGTDWFARFTSEGHVLTFALSGTVAGELPVPVVDGDTAVFPDVAASKLAGVDLVVRATTSGIDHWLVFGERPTADVATDLDLAVQVRDEVDGVAVDTQLSQTRAGVLELHGDADPGAGDEKKVLLSSASPPVAWDSSGVIRDESFDPVRVAAEATKDPVLLDAAATTSPSQADGYTAPEPVTDAEVAANPVQQVTTVELEAAVDTVSVPSGPVAASKSAAASTSSKSSRKLAATKTVDAGLIGLGLPEGYLTDPDTVFPVVVDPSPQIPTFDDTWVDSANPKSANASSPMLRVGKNPTGGAPNRTFVKFQSTAFTNKDILSATLLLRNYTSANCTGSVVLVHRIGQIWSGPGLTWANQPAVWGSPAPGYGLAHGASGCAGDWARWDVLPIVQTWAADPSTNFGFRVSASNEATVNAWRLYRSLENAESTGVQPTLQVSWNEPPVLSADTVSAIHGRPGAPSPTLSAVISDPDGGNVLATWSIYNSAGALVSSTNQDWLPSGSTTTFKPSNLGEDAYTVRVHAWDGRLASPDVSFPLYVDLQNPGPTSRTSSQFVENAWSPGVTSGTFAFSASDTGGAMASGVDHYLYGLDVAVPDKATASGVNTATLTPGDGWHYLVVRAVDRVGNLGPIQSKYFFGTRPAVVTPTDGAVVQATTNLVADVPAGASAVSFYYRRADAEAWTPIPAGDVTKDGTVLTGWPYVFPTATANGAKSPEVEWNLAATLGRLIPAGSSSGSIDGTLQVAACVGTTCPTTPTAPGANLPSTPTANSSFGHKVTVDSNAFSIAAVDEAGPVGVNLVTGNTQISATDLTVPGGDGTSLSIERVHNTAVATTATPASTGGATGPLAGIFGPGWTAALSVDSAGVAWASAAASPAPGTTTPGDYGGVNASTMVTLTAADGSIVSFSKDEEGEWWPEGDAMDSGLELSAVTTTTQGIGCTAAAACWLLVDLDGVATVFAPQATTGTGAASQTTYRLAAVKEPGTSAASSFTYGTVPGTTTLRPLQVTTPNPSGQACADPSGTWSVGCRGLAFTYNTGATSSTPAGTLAAVSYITKPTDTTLTKVDVACYRYNSSGRLELAWDPRDIPTAAADPTRPITCGDPVRPVRYGYDTAGRVTSLTPAWKAAGGPIAGWDLTYDTSFTPARLTTVTRAHLSGSAGAGNAEVYKVFYRVPLAPGSNAERPDLRSDATKTWAQTDAPNLDLGATAICRPGDTAPASSTGDLSDCDLSYLNADGRVVNTADYSGTGAAGWHITTSEYDTAGNTVRALTAANRELALTSTSSTGSSLGLPADPAVAALQLSDINLYRPNELDEIPDLVDSYGPLHLTTITEAPVQNPDGTAGSVPAGALVAAREHTHVVYDTGLETEHPKGLFDQTASFRLPMETTVTASLIPDAAATLSGADVLKENGWKVFKPADYEVDARKTRNLYSLTNLPAGAPTGADKTLGWKYRTPLQTIVDPGGLAITSTTLLNADGRVIQTRQPSEADTDTGAGTLNTTYYTAGGTGDCTGKPAWVGLICKTAAANATPTAGLPSLVTTTVTGYDYLDRPLSSIDTATPAGGGTPVTRTAVAVPGFNSTLSGTAPTYTSSNPYAATTQRTHLTGGAGTAVPASDVSFDAATGLALSQSSGGKTQTSSFDDFGRPVSYNENTTATGAQANTVTTTYNPTSGEVTQIRDGRLTRTLTWDAGSEKRGLLTGQSINVRNASGTNVWSGGWTGNYNADSTLASQTDPDQITTSYLTDPSGATTAQVAKNTAGTVKWTDQNTYTIHGQAATHANPSGTQTYGYDTAGRLIRADDTAVGASTSCATRTYGFDRNGNRLNRKTYTANANGTCATTTGAQAATPTATLTSTFDAADRLQAAGSHTGLTYDTLGRITSLPAADAGGTAATTSYYANDLVQSQTAGTTTTTWSLDAASRLASWTTTTGSSTVAKTNHYADTSDSPTWVAENADASQWTAYLTDMTGDLAGNVTQTGAVQYTYTNLHGDTLATSNGGVGAGMTSETYSLGWDEYGNPRTGQTATRYGWLGANKRSTETPANLTLMGVRLYAPALGLFLSVDPIRGGNTTAYAYPQDPINGYDLTGRSYKPNDDGTDGGPPEKGVHTKNARPSSKGKHEAGDRRRGRDKGGEKGDKRRRGNPNMGGKKKAKQSGKSSSFAHKAAVGAGLGLATVGTVGLVVTVGPEVAVIGGAVGGVMTLGGLVFGD